MRTEGAAVKARVPPPASSIVNCGRHARLSTQRARQEDHERKSENVRQALRDGKHKPSWPRKPIKQHWFRRSDVAWRACMARRSLANPSGYATAYASIVFEFTWVVLCSAIAACIEFAYGVAP